MQPAGSGSEASMRPRFTGKSAPKAEEMVSMSAPGPSLTLFAATHDSSAETLAPMTIVSAQLMGGMPEGCQQSSFNGAVTFSCSNILMLSRQSLQ